MNRRAAWILWAAVGVGCFAGVVAAILHSTDQVAWEKVHLDSLPLLGASAVFVSSYLLASAIWYLILGLTGSRGAVLKEMSIWLVSQFGKFVPANVTVLAIRLGRSSQRPAGVVLAYGYETVFHVAIAASLGAPSLMLLWGRSPSVRWIAVGVVPLIVLALAPRLWPRLANEILRRLGKVQLDGSAPTRRAILLVIVVAVAYWLMVGTSFWLFVDALSAPIPWTVAVSTMAFSWVVGFVAIGVPGGIGIREGVMVFLLSPLIGPGSGVLVAATHRVWTLVLDIVVCGSALIFERLRRDLSSRSPSRGRAQEESEDPRARSCS